MPNRPPLVLLGCGYTLQRVARSALAEGRGVILTTRDPARLESLARAGAQVHALDLDEPASVQALTRAVPQGSVAIHSVPVMRTDGGLADPTPRLLQDLAPRLERLVYLSSTGVYGRTPVVDETTPAAPVTQLQQLRVAAESCVEASVASSCVLRPAAIYGPGRGVHVMLLAGRYRLVGEGKNVVSRIHVDALAALVHAAVDHEVTGAWPVADEEPATAAEVAAFVCDRLGLPRPPSVAPEDVHETMRFTRRVDGRAICGRLGVTLRYPGYREGIPAAIDEASRT